VDLVDAQERVWPMSGQIEAEFSDLLAEAHLAALDQVIDQQLGHGPYKVARVELVIQP